MKMERNCERLRQHIDLLIDNQLDRDSMSLLQEHLRYCRSCRRAVKNREAMAARIREAGREVQAPPGLRSRISRAASVSSPYRRLLKGAAAVVLVCLLALFGFFHFLGRWNPGQLKMLEGELVCMGKKLEERYRVHWDCGNYGHLPVLKTATGDLWHLVKNEPALQMAKGMTDEFHPRVRVVAHVYPEEHFLEVQSYQYLAGVTNE